MSKLKTQHSFRLSESARIRLEVLARETKRTMTQVVEWLLEDAGNVTKLEQLDANITATKLIAKEIREEIKRINK